MPVQAQQVQQPHGQSKQSGPRPRLPKVPRPVEKTLKQSRLWNSNQSGSHAVIAEPCLSTEPSQE